MLHHQVLRFHSCSMLIEWIHICSMLIEWIHICKGVSDKMRQVTPMSTRDRFVHSYSIIYEYL